MQKSISREKASFTFGMEAASLRAVASFKVEISYIPPGEVVIAVGIAKVQVASHSDKAVALMRIVSDGGRKRFRCLFFLSRLPMLLLLV